MSIDLDPMPACTANKSGAAIKKEVSEAVADVSTQTPEARPTDGNGVSRKRQKPEANANPCKVEQLADYDGGTTTRGGTTKKPKVSNGLLEAATQTQAYPRKAKQLSEREVEATTTVGVATATTTAQVVTKSAAQTANSTDADTNGSSSRTPKRNIPSMPVAVESGVQSQKSADADTNDTSREMQRRCPPFTPFSVEREEYHYRMVKRVKKKLYRWLPTVTRDQISTASATSYLEQKLRDKPWTVKSCASRDPNKPVRIITVKPSHLQQLQMDISQIWREFIDDTEV